MAKLIRISPVTRINGFWNLEVDVDDGHITDARSSGIFFRGFEEILKGRDPRDAAYLTERICGICSTAHAIAASHAMEDALKIEISSNATLLRNLSFGADLLQNHLRHFYLLTVLDFVRGPEQPPFIPRYESDYRLNTHETDRVMESYRQHFDIARITHEMVTIFGGKAPHQHGIIPGGVTTPPTVDRIQKFMGSLETVLEYINGRLIPDAQLLARRYDDYFEIGRGYENLLAYGNFQVPGKNSEFVMPFGVYSDGRIDKFNPERIREHVHYSWFVQDSPKHPVEEETNPEPDKEGAYSWVKAPRYAAKPFETGPIAHLWMKGDYRRGISTMDRILARVMEAKIVGNMMKEWLKQLEPGKPIYRPYEMPDKEVEGVGYTGAMRGALAHWVRFKGNKILHYQIVTPSAWVCSPRDAGGMRGPLEEALVGTPIADTDNPIEIGRVGRSFDPCLACAVHLIKTDGSRQSLQIM